MSNDRFKFRVWDQDTYEKETECQMLIGTNGKLYMRGIKQCAGNFSKIENELSKKELKDIIIEQCTGLKDKNGKLIFEGDVVRFADVCFDKPIKREVYWDNEMCEFGVKQSGALLHAQFEDEYEIVGTIHDKEK